MMATARDETGLKVVTEVVSPGDVELVARYADILQLGTRNMQNYALLQEAGRSGKPVLLKRGMSSTIEEWLLAAEYVLSQGNRDVILCERGIRTFETATRFTLDLNAVPLSARAVAPSGDRRSLAGDRPLVAGAADVAGRGGGRRSRPDRRGAPDAQPGALGRRAVARLRELRPPDGRPAALLGAMAKQLA